MTNNDPVRIEKSMIFMLLAVCFFFLMNLIVKSLEGIPTVQIVFFRAWVAIIICLGMLKKAKVNPFGTHKKLLILRGIFGTIALIGFFATIAHIPLATAATLQNLSPIFTTIFAVLFLKEEVRLIQWLLFILAFVGVSFIQGFTINTETIWMVIGIASAMGSAAAYTCIGKIGTKEHPLVIIFYFPLVTIPCVLPFVIHSWVMPSLEQWILLILVGIVVQTAQYFMTISYQVGANSKVSMISYLGVVLAILAGYFMFDESPSNLALLGIGIVICSVSGNSFVKSIVR